MEPTDTASGKKPPAELDYEKELEAEHWQDIFTLRWEGNLLKVLEHFRDTGNTPATTHELCAYKDHLDHINTKFRKYDKPYRVAQPPRKGGKILSANRVYRVYLVKTES